ncbi:hypothetical protein DSCOOX_65190 [Desulfosarcina ovata subsp. ovata]|uniref:Uncharacterized protein n=1 Tax=Desulfosarcina ovata subsp. ovata TaxID=2752305 RepID=A0A5K8ALC5_9BACT|nr:hypothetical protein DSCOOX_65190 [Desulfosarcina ovata subsp. ovata]
MKDETDLKIDRIPPVVIFHWIFDILNPSLPGKKSDKKLNAVTLFVFLGSAYPPDVHPTVEQAGGGALGQQDGPFGFKR